MSLPDELVNMICRYNSHPVSDIIREVKQKFPDEILFYNKLTFMNKKNNIINKKIKQNKQFNEKINKIYLFGEFCSNSYIILATILFILYYIFEIENHKILFLICFGYFYFYFVSLIFLIYFSLNISTEDK
jgi:hypothetical protein